MRIKIYLLVSFVALWVLAGCRKDKPGHEDDLSGDQLLNEPGTSVRLFNFFNADIDIKVNNISLTAFSSSSMVAGNRIGLSLFPDNVWHSGDNGSPVTLPASLLDKQGQLHLIVRARVNVSGQPLLNIDTTLTETPLDPKDYYVMADGRLQAVNRETVVPARADHFKIRVVNFGALTDTLKLQGPVILTYADGRPVDDATSYVQPGQLSPYLELPYGAYQFKLFVATAPGVPDLTRQLAEIPVAPKMRGGVTALQENLVSRIQGYKPGGTYSLAIAPAQFGYDFNGQGNAVYFRINAYRLIEEKAAPRNTDWAKLQLINVLDDRKLRLRVDGADFTGEQGYGQYSDLQTLVQGNHQVEVVDDKGAVLAQSSFFFYPYDNITAWMYSKEGKPGIVFTNTDFTSTMYRTVNVAGGSTTIDYGTDGAQVARTYPYALSLRFMNFSDEPYATFTKDGSLLVSTPDGAADTLAYPQAYTNLQPGTAVTRNPFAVYPSRNTTNWYIKPKAFPAYVALDFGATLGQPMNNPFPIRAHRSAPASGGYAPIVPGLTLTAVAPLQAVDFYKGTQTTVNGFYTVALIGNTFKAGSQPGRLLLIKHNK